MISKTLTANGAKGHHKFELYVEENRTDTNNSYMNFTFKLISLGGNWDWYGWGGAITYSVWIGDNNFTGAIPDYDGHSTVTLSARNGIQIPHNSDGTKTISISFSVNDGSNQSYTCGNASASDNLVLSRLHKPPVVSFNELVEKNSLLLPQMTNTIVNYCSISEFKVNYTTYDGATVKNIKLYDRTGMDYEGRAKTLVTNANNGSITIDFGLHWTDRDFTKEEFILEVIDSLGAITRIKTPMLTIIQYRRPNVVTTLSNVKRNGQLTGKVNLKLVSSFYNGKINNKQNTFTIKFKYWQIGTAESNTYYTIPNNVVNISGNDLTISKWNMAKNGVIINDIDKRYAYRFKILIEDSFKKASATELDVPKGTWIYCKFKDRIDFNRITIQGKDFVPTTIWTGSLQGGSGITLNGAKRFLDIYTQITFGDRSATLKYTIDTSINNVVYGSNYMTSFDENNIITTYISEAYYNKSNKTLFHNRTGYFNNGSGAYTDRNNSVNYIIYQIDTYD